MEREDNGADPQKKKFIPVLSHTKIKARKQTKFVNKPQENLLSNSFD